MGYPELLRVLGDEAAREAAALRAAGRAEADRIVAAARAAAAEATAALLAREAREAEAALRLAAAVAAQGRERRLLEVRRERLSALRDEVAARLPAAAREPGLLSRLVGEVLAAAPAGRFVLEVDPGDEAAVQAALCAGHPEAAGRAELRAAPARRGGVALVSGRLTLDDTLPARLERAWPALEAQVVRLLFGEG